MPFKRRGSEYWWIRVGGVRKSSGTTDYEEAAALETKRKHDRWLSQYMGVKPKRTWQEAVAQRAKEVAQSMASWSDEQQRLLWWDAHLRHVKDLNEITREMIASIIEEYRPVNLAGPSPQNTTANKYVRAVATILNAAERKWAWGNRAPLLKTYQEPPARDVCPTPVEVLRLVDTLPAHSADIALYGAMTMHRRANVTGLEWSMIDWEKGAVKIAGKQTKTGKSIYVPLNATALAILKRRRKAADRHPVYVFHYRGNKIFHVVTKAWRKRREAAGLVENITLHTMRHCGNSWLAQRGVPAEIRARLGGWSMRGAKIMDGYTHLFLDNLRPYLAILDDEINAARQVLEAEKAAEIAVANCTSAQTRHRVPALSDTVQG
ncbi:MAG: tyrosine-type recombinase/integrase [Betaproteobacteria bacterium]|nr:tyrosine-type recombinase/integrase [Betaproteobacteria bacterium]